MVKIVIDGGILMGPFVLLVVLWITATLIFILRQGRTLKHLASLLLFPVAFGILAISQWALQWHAIYTDMEVSGFPDGVQFTEDALRVTRSTLVVAGAGGLSLIFIGTLFLLPCWERGQAEQVAGGSGGGHRP